MYYRIRLLKGIIYPKLIAYQLRQSEELRGLLPKSVLLIAFSILIAFFAGFYGIGTESLSKELTIIKSSDFELHKLLFIIGKMIFAAIHPLLILFVPTAIFWTLTDLEFKKLLYMQMFVLFMLLIDQWLDILFAIFLGINDYSSPLSLGVLAQYVTDNEFLIYFFGCISIFQIWAIFLQIIYLRLMCDKGQRLIIVTVLSVNLLFWIISSMFSHIQFEKLL